MAREPGRASARINQRVSRITSRLDRYRTPLGLLVLAFGGFLAYVAFVSTTGPPFQPRYEIHVSVPSDAPVMRVGQAVRVGGRLAGLVSDVDPDRADGTTTVTANITKPGFRDLPADTEAYVRVHSIVYETYLELRPGDSPERLENGDRVETAADSGVDLLEAVQLFDEEARQSLRQSVVNLGFGVAGRGRELNESFGKLEPLARDAASQLRAATREQGALGELVTGASATTRGLRGERPDDVDGLISSGEQTLSTVAGRSAELGRAIDLLRPFEDEFLETAPIAEPLLDDVAALSGELEPGVRSLTDQLPTVNRLLGLGGTLREESERIVDVADPLLAAARPVIWGLYPTMTSLSPLNRDLANLKATVEPYKPEIRQAGLRLGDATSHGFAQGLAPGAPAVRVVPVLTPRPCTNPFPRPGEAEGHSCP